MSITTDAASVQMLHGCLHEIRQHRDTRDFWETCIQQLKKKHQESPEDEDVAAWLQLFGCSRSPKTQHHDSREDHAVRQSISSPPAKIEELHNAVSASFRQVEKIMRTTRNKLNKIRAIQDYQRIKYAREAGDEETIRNLYDAMATDTRQAEEILRKATAKIDEIRIQNDCRIQTHEVSNSIVSQYSQLVLVSSGSCPNRARGRTSAKLFEDDDDEEEEEEEEEDSIEISENNRLRLMEHEIFMNMLRDAAKCLPLYMGEAPGAKPPALCGAIPAEPTYVAKIGDMVAALVEDERPEGDYWDLAEVVDFNSTKNEYEVVEYNMEGELTDHHTLPRSRVIPLPLMNADPATDPRALLTLFPKGSTVMAMYPQTTRFHKAIVQRPPTTATDEYLILFENPPKTSYSGYSSLKKVAQRYVISVERSEKQSSP